MLHSETAEDLGKLILRLTVGVLVLLHGFHKLMNGVSGIEGMVTGAGLPALLAYGVFLGEVLGPVLLIVGFYARVGAALIMLNMIVAIVLAHSQQIFLLTPQGGWQLELQGLYLFAALALLLMGPGRMSLNGR